MREIFDSKNLARLPNYGYPNSGIRNDAPINSILNLDNAKPFYDKLKNYLAINNTINTKPIRKFQSALYLTNGGVGCWHWHEVKWMPRLEPNWYRLSFRLFCIFYGIEERSGE